MPMEGNTEEVKEPYNIYKEMMLTTYQDWIFSEGQALELKGKWASQFSQPQLPLDLEIGCGNGFFFHERARTNPQRNLIGIEIKYKPLVQTLRRAYRDNLPNTKGIRLEARLIDHTFGESELNEIFIFFPDPWPKRRHQKNRLLTTEYFNKLSRVQKPGQILTFKTDSAPYFEFVETQLPSTPYKIVKHTRDLHQSPFAEENFITSFERIFMKKGTPINFVQLINNK